MTGYMYEIVLSYIYMFLNELCEWKATCYLYEIILSRFYAKEIEAWLISNIPAQMLMKMLLFKTKIVCVKSLNSSPID